MNRSARRSLLVGVSVTRRFDEKDAEAVVAELHGVTERPRVSRPPQLHG